MQLVQMDANSYQIQDILCLHTFSVSPYRCGETERQRNQTAAGTISDLKDPPPTTLTHIPIHEFIIL